MLTFFIKYDIPGCQRTFQNAHTYKSHLGRAHKGVTLRQPVHLEDSDAEEGMDIEMEDVLPEESGHDSEMPWEENLYDVLEERLEGNKKLNALYLLRNREAHLLTQKALKAVGLMRQFMPQKKSCFLNCPSLIKSQYPYKQV